MVGQVLLATSLPTTALFIEVLVGALLFGGEHVRRRRPAVVVACTGAAVLLLSLAQAQIALSVLGEGEVAGFLAAGDPTAFRPLDSLVVCALVLVATMPLVRCVFGLGWWACAYCATAGYTLQNLASGLAETAQIALGPEGLGLVGAASGIPQMDSSAVTLVSCVLVYLVAWWALIRRIDPAGLDGQVNRVMLLMVAVVVFGVIGFDLVLKGSVIPVVGTGVALVLRGFHALVCVFVILAETELVVVRQLEQQKATAERLLAERERQYELSRANIDAINLKCHDLRHQIRHLADGGAEVSQAALADIAREVSVYDSQVRTGNDALDTILTEKSLLCERSGITLTCMADGAALGFMGEADLYALFGNALDNAIEAVGGLADPGLRSVSLIVRELAGMVSIHVENYRDASRELRFVDGLPVSTKGDALNHGFGTRSMRGIVERYGGTLTLSAGERTFCVDALLPRG